MFLPHHLVRSASGVFHFRLRIPADLQPVIGCRVVKRSLHTRDPGAAKICAYTLSLRYARLFAVHREAAMPKPPSVADLLAAFDQGDVRTYEIGLDANTRQLTHLKTDGTQKDHAAALEALGVIFAQPLPAPPARLTPPTPPAPPKPKGMTLGQAWKRYQQAEAPNLKPNTWSQRERACASFVKTMGADTPVDAITRAMASSWAHDLIVAGTSKRTVANIVSHVAQLFRMLVVRGDLLGENAVKGVVVLSKKEKSARRQAGFQWEPLELDGLKRMCDPEQLKTVRTDHVRWGIVMGLYTGARVGEIAQLFLRDFVIEGDVPCVKFTVSSDGQTLKTEASERLVPLHPDLIRLGLWERVERLRKAGDERLFPNMRIDSRAGPGNALSKGFTYYLKQLGITPRRANGTVGFHSLRKNVIQALQGSGLSAERRRAFVGHEQGDQDVHEASYMRAWKAEELAALFPGLRWGEWLDFLGMRRSLNDKGDR